MGPFDQKKSVLVVRMIGGRPIDRVGLHYIGYGRCEGRAFHREAMAACGRHAELFNAQGAAKAASGAVFRDPYDLGLPPSDQWDLEYDLRAGDEAAGIGCHQPFLGNIGQRDTVYTIPTGAGTVERHAKPRLLMDGDTAFLTTLGRKGVEAVHRAPWVGEVKAPAPDVAI